jgi:hypothetical protein
MQTFRILDSPVYNVTDSVNGAVTQTSSIMKASSYNAITRNSLGNALYVDPTKPMLNNQITLETGQAFLRQALLERGFVEDPVNPDFEVAFYASAQERLDVRDWGYGYCCYYDDYDVYVYTEGTVLIDLVNPRTQNLMWRGSGVASVSDNPRKYMEKVGDIIYEIIERVPAPGPVPIVRQTAVRQTTVD